MISFVLWVFEKAFLMTHKYLAPRLVRRGGPLLAVVEWLSLI